MLINTLRGAVSGNQAGRTSSGACIGCASVDTGLASAIAFDVLIALGLPVQRKGHFADMRSSEWMTRSWPARVLIFEEASHLVEPGTVISRSAEIGQVADG
jgi:hypothetical protein